MGDVEKLRLELQLAEKGEELEHARAVMHEGDERTEEQIAEFKALSNEYQLLREGYREKYPPVASNEGDDASPAPDGVAATTAVREG
jgi:hypothetical protein